MRDATHPSGDFATAFEASFARLQVCLEEACASQPDWPAGVVAAIRAALNFAAAEPAAASLLTNEALAAGADGIARHQRMVAHFAERLGAGREERPENKHLPETIERALVGGVAMLIAQRLDRGAERELPAIAPEATQFLLTPYLGAQEAGRIVAALEPTAPEPRFE